jgi:signal transduction histidine kinase
MYSKSMQFETVYHVALITYTALGLFVLLHHAIHYYSSPEKKLYGLFILTMVVLLIYCWLDIRMFSQTQEPQLHLRWLVSATYALSCLYGILWVTLLQKMLSLDLKRIIRFLWATFGVVIVLLFTRLIYTDEVVVIYNTAGSCFYIKLKSTVVSDIITLIFAGALGLALVKSLVRWGTMGRGDRLYLAASIIAYILAMVDVMVYLQIIDFFFTWTLGCAFFALSTSLRLSGRNYELTQEVEQANRELRLFNEKALQMERLSTMGMIVRGIVHDLKNYFMSVGASAELAEMSLLQEQPADIKSSLQEIQTSANDACNYLSRMVEMAEGAENVKPEPVVLVELAEQVIRVSGLRVQRLEINHHVDIPVDLKVMADARLLTQVLLNLLFNAMKALPPPPANRTVTFRTEPGPGPGMVTLRVEDSGPGLPEHLRQRVIQPEQGLRAAADGIGLFQVAENCRRMGMQMDVVCEPGQGTSFRFAIPVASAT